MGNRVQQAYVALWREVQKYVQVMYESAEVDEKGQVFEHGYFHPMWRDVRPCVVICRPRVSSETPWEPDPDHRALSEACSLAHEYGHFLSFHKKRRTATYHTAINLGCAWPDLSPEQQRHVLSEERRAWDLGRNAVAALGLPILGALRKRRREGLGIYRKLMTQPSG